MINFNWVSAQNFLSIGNTPIIFGLNKHTRTLINGENGAGKSTQLDALVYALFNKPIRDVKLGQLVNSVNKKKMLAKANFTINGVVYEVHRGQKPAVFKVFVNGEPINEDAAAKDLQAKLENDILNCDYKTFSQVVIMSSTNFSYFMELSAAERRGVVEAMLDIEVIGKMSTLMKERVKEVKHRADTNEINLAACKSQVDAKQSVIDQTTVVSGEHLESLSTKFDELNVALNEATDALDKLNAVDLESLYPEKPVLPPAPVTADAVMPSKPDCGEKPELPPEPVMGTVELPDAPELIDYNFNEAIQKNMDDKQNLLAKQASLVKSAKDASTAAKFYTDNDNCDRCHQPIDDNFKNDIVNKTNAELNELRREHQRCTEETEKLDATLEKINAEKQVVEQYIIDCDKIRNDAKLDHSEKVMTWNIECQRITNEYETKVYEIIGEWKAECQRITNDVNTQNTLAQNEYNSVCKELTSKYDYEVSKIQTDHNTKLNYAHESVKNITDESNKLRQEIADLKAKQNNNIQQYHDELDVLNQKLTVLMKESADVREEMELCALGTQMLKDSGLKAKIVQQYLPAINTSINEYLDLMGANYSFVLDEGFNETLKSRYRDNFSYGNFSNGERSRINFAIMLMWRKLAQSKNTVSSNLLFIDEILDSSLDKEGIGAIMDIFDSMEDSNIFVISHRKEIADHFDATIHAKKVGNYSSYDITE